MKKVVGFAGVLLLAAGVALWVFGRPAYRHYKEKHAIARAEHFLAAGDFRNANLSARQTLALNPRNLEACQIMAHLAELARAPQVLDWRRRIAEVAPTLDNKLKLAATALLLEPAPCAFTSQILAEAARPGTNFPGYHSLAAELALKLNRVSDAEAHFLAASRLEPSNQLHQLNLAVLRLRSGNDTVVAASRTELERFGAKTNATLARIALQWLASDSLSRKDLAAAQLYSTQVLALPTAGLGDRLQHVAILREAHRPEFASFLTAVQDQAVTNAVAAREVANWMISHELAASALSWLTNCPTKVQSEQPFPLARLDCYLALGDWAGMEAWLADQHWGEFEFVRLAALSRAQQGQRNQPGADAHWRLAVRQAGNHVGSLSYLLGLARAWGRERAVEDLLWQIFDYFPRELWAGRELERVYSAAGNTRALNRLYGAMAARDAGNFVARNNFAATAMLLGTGLAKAHETAQAIYRAHPTEPIVVSTYAWSLQLQGRTREGLGALEKLGPENLHAPPVALYYGLLLCANHQNERAAPYFAQIDRAILLPEEKELLAEAQKN